MSISVVDSGDARARADAPMRVGLTGGIASGKSTVAELFSGLGIAVIDTDRIAHELTAAGGAAIAPLTAAFGSDILDPDGGLDRGRMRERVFGHPEALKDLERILHPMIYVSLDCALGRVCSPYVLLAIPLLVETGVWRERVARVLVIDCPQSLQRERALTRPGLTAPQLEAILAVQATRAQRLAVADDVIDNGAGLAPLEAQVKALDARYRTLCAELRAAASDAARAATPGAAQHAPDGGPT